jgi:hypothetical protein
LGIGNNKKKASWCRVRGVGGVNAVIMFRIGCVWKGWNSG